MFRNTIAKSFWSTVMMAGRKPSPLARHGSTTLSKATSMFTGYSSMPSSARTLSSMAGKQKQSPADLLEIVHARQLWKSYLASGRGSHALFQFIDKTGDGVLHPDEIHSFMLAIVGEAAVSEEDPATAAADKDGSLPATSSTRHLQFIFKRALLELEERAQADPDHSLTFDDFQKWLITATTGGYQSMQEWYERHPQSQERSPLKRTKQRPSRTKPEEVDESHAWNANTMSQSLRKMQYAVRGQVVIAADEMAAQNKPIIYTNVGNPHAVGQAPITFYRQVLALCDLPPENGILHPNVNMMFPADVIERATHISQNVIGSVGTGAYTHSQGLQAVRQDVASFIQQRDGHEAYSGDIFLTNGASSGIELILNGLIAHDDDAILIPIPQYPIYSALITRLGGNQVGYELDEESGWAVSREQLNANLEEARANELNVKAMVIINPGNPTGQVLSREDLATICKFCADEGIVLLADEVYQRNVYEGEFISAKKVAMETPGCEHLELVSFHSTSKGLIGECGRRGGYMELHNIDPYVQSQIYKLASSGLCSGVSGQIMTDLMVKGPEPGGESYDLFQEEESSIYNSLAKRAQFVVAGLNSIDGITCQPAQGAMYCFPRIEGLPARALEEAKKQSTTPDTLYALSLLKETGICVVPASGFGQKEGRVGFRTTFLPPEERLYHAIEEFGRHHQLFCDQYASTH